MQVFVGAVSDAKHIYAVLFEALAEAVVGFREIGRNKYKIHIFSFHRSAHQGRCPVLLVINIRKAVHKADGALAHVYVGDLQVSVHGQLLS